MELNGFSTTADWLKSAKHSLEASAAVSDDPQEKRIALQVLLAHVLEKPRAWIIAHPEAGLTSAQEAQLDDLLARLAEGEPLPYLLGHWEFFGLSFAVSPATLIPRPETELLVEQAIHWLRRHPNRRLAADVGTGSGCIAVNIAKHIPDLRVLAGDRSLDALRMARKNAQAHDTAGQIHFVQADLLSAAEGPFDLVCANLPYIPRAALTDLPVARYEPLSALDGGADGLDLIRALAADSARWLAKGGLLLLEMQFDQGEAVTAVLREHLPDAVIDIIPDLAGLPRLVRAERS